MIHKKCAIFLPLLALVLSGCGIIVTPARSSSSTQNPDSTYVQPEEHGDGNYNYDELEEADVEAIVSAYWTEHFEEGARWYNMRGFSDVDVYFYNRETGVKKDREITYPFSENYLYGPFDLRAVGYFNGQYYKLPINLNNTTDKKEGYFDVAFDNDDLTGTGRTNMNKQGFYGLTYAGFDGDYHFVITPNNRYLKAGKTEFEFRAHLNHDNFKVNVQDISYNQKLPVSYTGMSSIGNVRYYYAPIVDDVIGEYTQFNYEDRLPIGKYALKATANLNNVAHETEPKIFNVLPLTFDGCEYEDEHEFPYKSSHLYDYSIKTPITINGTQLRNVSISWVDPTKIIDMTTAKDGVVSFRERVVFKAENFADYITDVYVRILINGFAHPAIPDVTYTGEEQQPKMTNFVDELMEIDEESVLKATNVGEYQATVRFKKNIQGKFADGTTEHVITWHINKANPVTFYETEVVDSYYELELEDENGNVVSAGRKDSFDETYSIPYAAVGKRAYVRLYHLVGNTRKLMETDNIVVTRTGELSAYGYDFDKRAVYFDCDAYDFYFQSTLKLGDQEETNFEPLDIRFNCYVAMPYEHEFVLDREHVDAAILNRYSPYGGFGGEGDDFYYKASLMDDEAMNALLCKLFDGICEVRIQFKKSEVATNGNVSIYIGNDVEQIQSSKFPYFSFKNDITIRSCDSPSNLYESTCIANSVSSLTRLDGPQYLKFCINGNYNGAGHRLCYIKSITIRYNGQMQDLTT